MRGTRCEGRDVAALFRFAQAQAGASQARLAMATGISQGRVNEIINGRRGVTALEVFERIADGLACPMTRGCAWAWLPATAGGVLPAPPMRRSGASSPGSGRRPGRSGSSRREARQIDVLAVRGLGLVALTDSLLWPVLAEGQRHGRVFLLDPDCHAARLRAGEIGEPPASFASGIRLAIERLAELAGRPGTDLAVYVYEPGRYGG